MLAEYSGVVAPLLSASSTGLKNVVAAVEWAVKCELAAEMGRDGKQQQQQQQQQRASLNLEPISSQHLRHVIAQFLDGESFTPEYDRNVSIGSCLCDLILKELLQVYLAPAAADA